MLVSTKSKILNTHMNTKTGILAFTVCAIAFSVPTPAFAGKGARKGKGDPAEKAARLGMMLRRFDTDKSGAISGAESEALRKGFDVMRKLDANNDGTLDDAEIATIKIGNGKREGKRAAGKRAKKNV